MKSNRKRSSILLCILLAVVCITTVELVVCRYCDPELFDTITAPVVSAAKATADTAKAAAQAAGQAIHSAQVRIETAIEEAQAKREAERLQAEAEAAKQAADANSESLSDTDAAEDQSVTPPLLNTSSSICDPSVTELRTIDDKQVLTGGPIKIVYYQQNDEHWGEMKYGSDKIGTHGCGPTAMAMVVSSLTETAMDPSQMSQWAVKKGHWARGSGSYLSIVIGTATAFGLQAESFPLRSPDALREVLMSGNRWVALVGPGHFTQKGHFIILRGVTLSGDILVADPSSLERSLTSWDPQLILDELSKSTANGSPLWLISVPKSSEWE